MKKNEKYICLFLGVSSLFLLVLTFFNGKYDINSMLKASITEQNVISNEVLDAARKMALDNMSNMKEENVITIRDLIRKKYLNGTEIDPVTKKEYDENTRIVIEIKNKEIKDIYITNILFKNKFSCDSVCYLDFDNYVYFDNDIYRIIKLDQQGNIYITKNEIKQINKDDIDFYFKNLFNSYNKDIVSNVVSISDIDLRKSNIVEKQKNIVVNTNSGYKMFNIDTEKVEEIKDQKVSVYPVIVLKNDITYEKGKGTKFNPYVLGE